MPTPPKTDSDTRPLSDFLCFAVYSANLAFGRAYKPILDKLGLTYTQYIALVALAEADEQTVGALGEKLFLESNTLTPILKKLEQAGYLRRQRDPADERQVRVSLTPAGRKLVAMDPGASLFEASGLGDAFAAARKTVTTLRDNLLLNTQKTPVPSASPPSGAERLGEVGVASSAEHPGFSRHSPSHLTWPLPPKGRRGEGPS